MIYAQIKNGIIVNSIVINDESIVPLLSKDFDACIRIDNLSVQPGMGWTYDGSNFTCPNNE